MGAVAGLVPNKQVDPAVVIRIEPDRGKRRFKRKQAGFFGDIGKGAVAVVSKKGVGKKPKFTEPGTAHDVNIRQAIVVVVGLDVVKAAGHADETRLRRPVLEMPIAKVFKEMALP